MTCRRWRLTGWALLALGLGSCGVAPRSFRALNDPAPIIRARAIGLGVGLPAAQVVPALIDRLDDPDPVVRLTAHEELRGRTGQDFGFIPWLAPAENAPAVARWRAWWDGQPQAGLAKPR